jgi:hypothetical protein
LLLNWQSLWGVWVTILGNDWCWTFKGVEGCGQRKLYEVGWGEKKEGNFLLGGWEKLSFDSSSYEVWSLFGFW